MISEYKDAISRQEKLLGESIGAKLLKKSSSLFSLPESNEKVQRQVPKLDWEARRRGDSASKSHTNSKSEKSNPDSKRNSTEKNPFEKIMGAFGSFFNEEGDIEYIFL